MIKRIFIIGVLGVVFTLVTTTAWALITPTKVLALPGIQLAPTGNESFIAFTTNSVGHPSHWDVWILRRSNGTSKRINPSGTEAYAGGFDPGTNTLIYQQVKGKYSDVFSYDRDTGKRVKVSAVSTGAWEWSPRVSASFISFFRDYKVNGVRYTGAYLYDRGKGTVKRIASWKATSAGTNGGVGDRYATWDVCTRKTCTVYLYDAQARTTKVLRTKSGRPQYGEAIDEVAGTLYFVRSGFGCGLSVVVLSVPLAHLRATPAKVAALPGGVDVAEAASLAANPDTGDLDYLFARVNCRQSTTDIYALRSISA